jgi:hypothetical protein
MSRLSFFTFLLLCLTSMSIQAQSYSTNAGSSSSKSASLASYLNKDYEITAISVTGWSGRQGVNPSVYIGNASAATSMPNTADTSGVSMYFYPDVSRTTETTMTGTAYITKQTDFKKGGGQTQSSTATVVISSSSTVGFSNVDSRGGQNANFGTITISYQKRVPKEPVIKGDIKATKPNSNIPARAVKPGEKVDVIWSTEKVAP